MVWRTLVSRCLDAVDRQKALDEKRFLRFTDGSGPGEACAAHAFDYAVHETAAVAIAINGVDGRMRTGFEYLKLDPPCFPTIVSRFTANTDQRTTMRPSRSTLFATISCVFGAASCYGEVARYGYDVKAAYPHDPNAFTQGLIYRDGYLYESTGQYGSSSVRQVDIETGRVARIRRFDRQYFVEGMVDWDDRLFLLTWQSEKGFVLALDDFSEQRTFAYNGQGWGLTRTDEHLVMSNGSDRLRFLDPISLKEVRSVQVTLNDQPVNWLNELEWIDGEIYSNVWQTDWVMRIDPETGRVTGVIDLSGLLPAEARRVGHTDVLNGIAYDAEGERLFVTGKYWPKLFEIELVEKGD